MILSFQRIDTEIYFNMENLGFDLKAILDPSCFFLILASANVTNYTNFVNDSSQMDLYNLAIPETSRSPEAAQKFITWATSKDYIQLVAEESGWVSVPPGTRTSTYENPNYQEVAPFASTVLTSIEAADIESSSKSTNLLEKFIHKV